MDLFDRVSMLKMPIDLFHMLKGIVVFVDRRIKMLEIAYFIAHYFDFQETIQHHDVGRLPSKHEDQRCLHRVRYVTRGVCRTPISVLLWSPPCKPLSPAKGELHSESRARFHLVHSRLSSSAVSVSIITHYETLESMDALVQNLEG